MSKKYLILLVCLMGCTAFAQNQSNIWYFGNKAGLDFNGPSPVALLDGALSTNEGIACISDENGNLLFYTNGVDVLDKTHNIMPNGFGLMGSIGSSQSGIIVPKPLNLQIYYIFTVAEDGAEAGLRYSEVDMSLNNGLGNVTAKNVPVQAQTTEQITAVLHNNGDDVWVISHDVGTNTFFSTRVTPNGVNPVSVVSSAGQVINAGLDSVGCMKASPDGKKLAMGNCVSGSQVFDFDTATGLVSNALLLPGRVYDYGVEFSPLSRLVYISNSDTAEIFQYNLDAADIAASELEITGNPDIYIYGGALQLAKDGKIYYTCTAETTLSVITSPDVIGNGCGFSADAISLGGRNAAYGLPPFIQSYFIPNVTAKPLCFGDSTEFSILSGAAPDSALWDFGDGNTSIQLTTQHTYAAPGDYAVTLTLIRQGQAFTYSKYIAIEALPVAIQPADVVLCDDGNPLFFDLNSLNNQILGVQNPANFSITYHSTNTDAEDGTNAVANNYEVFPDLQMLYARVTSLTGCYAITNVMIEKLPVPVIRAQNNYVLCQGDNIRLTAQGSYDSFIWSTGVTTTSILVSAPGNYSVTGVLAVGNVSCPSETVTVTLSARPEIIDVVISDWSDSGNSVEIIADGLPAGNEYSVDGINYQDSPLFTGLGYGPYTVFVRDTFGCGFDSEEIYLLMYPKFFTPNDDGINDIWQIKGIRLEPNTLIEVYDRFGKLLSAFNGRDAGWNGKFSGQQLPATDYWFVAKRQNGKIYKGHFSLLR